MKKILIIITACLICLSACGQPTQTVNSNLPEMYSPQKVRTIISDSVVFYPFYDRSYKIYMVTQADSTLPPTIEAQLLSSLLEFEQWYYHSNNRQSPEFADFTAWLRNKYNR